MKSIQSKGLDLNNKKILIRLDLNVPLNGANIIDTNRIDKTIPTLQYLLKNKAKIIILSHVGRPKGKIVNELSLKPVCNELERKLNQKISFITDTINKIKIENFFSERNNIVMLENLRFFKEEESDDSIFAENLANLADIYVNEAFSCSHRKHASVHSITKFIPSYSGIQLEAEVNSLIKITSNIKRPISCIIGGSKISTKITVIKNLIDKFDNIIFVGGMANNILKFKKYQIGKSIYEKNVDQIISEIFDLSEKKNCKIFFPLDVSTGKSVEEKSIIKKLTEISNDDMILDIGPETIKMIKNIINNSNTILWNGPAGYFENPEFSKGSNEIAKQIIKRKKENKIYCVSGGGDTVAVLNNFGLVKDFDFVSTAGGAFLEFLEGKELPGIKALNS
ncbi:phosphoglycerate kinase [Candidatus Pelagibacter communis]|uniref:phosphoglycerate kinase n=1 Tax=Pelagibacter ubique TaxID=198252 RepID=UPI00094D5AE5|nr:phosphoglycerate kinase [Candidatus Pelagibacter ubique]